MCPNVFILDLYDFKVQFRKKKILIELQVAYYARIDSSIFNLKNTLINLGKSSLFTLQQASSYSTNETVFM